MRSDLVQISAAYRRFADEEARGRSALYEMVARAIADDAEVLERLAMLAPAKRQPNLLLAAFRHAVGLPTGWAAFRETLLARWDAVRAVMLERSTQTNEPARCATLLPVLASLPQPLALIEVGASAGLCLLADRYAYDYGGRTLRPAAATAEIPVFACEANAATPLPEALPHIAWRAGLDLNPLDVTDADQVAWLETLVWPGQMERLTRLRAAVRVARADPPRVVRGDLRHGLATLAAEAPKDSTLVVFHTAVLAYVPDRGEREDFAAAVTSLCDFWIANESPRVFPAIAEKVPGGVKPGCFLLSLNGEPVAWTDPHGAAVDWIAGPAGAINP
jgi:hypothetical protein